MRCFAVVLAAVALSGGLVFAGENSDGKGASVLSEMTMHVIPQSHIDLAWWWRYEPETLEIVVTHTLETAFGNMEKFPEYTFTYLQAPAIEPLEESHPDLFYKLRYYAHNAKAMGVRIPNPDASGAEGRLAIGSGLWCEVDGSVPGGESLVRQCLYGKRYFWRVFGIDVRTAWFQDAWTHPWTYPQILKKSGMDSYMFTRPRGEGEPMFWWEGPDGSRVFAYKPLDEGGGSLSPQNEVDARLLDVNRRYGVKDDITLIGVGNHGGGAIRADVERMREGMARRADDQAKGENPPKMMFSTPERFVDAVLKESHEFPVVNTELPATIRGAYTTQAEIKKGNRLCENLLITLEKFSAIASRLGVRAYPQQGLYDAWKKVMLNQFHDTISGTDVLPSIEDALGRYASVEAWGRGELEQCLRAICARISTEGSGTPVVVFNPLAWERSDVAEVELQGLTGPCSITLRDGKGNPVPAQLVGQDRPGARGTVRFVFHAEGVPSLGYKVYWATVKRGAASTGVPAKDGEYVLENSDFTVRLDPATGCVASIFDKRAGREALDDSRKGNLIQILDDFGDSEGFLKSADGAREHNVWDGACADVASNPRITWLERGPVRTVVEVKKQFELARFTQRITLCAGVPRIDFEIIADWEGQNKMVKVGFPLSVSPAEATYEIQYGTIARPSTGEECAAQNWADLTDKGYGVSFLNDGRYGYDVLHNVIRLSVLRSPAGPVAATEEQGVHVLRYALYPHAGGWQEAATARQGHAFNNPLIAMAAAPHQGDLPSQYAFLTVTPGNVLAAVLKKAEDSGDLILRCYESAGQACQARISFAASIPADGAHAVDLLERSQKDIPVANNGLDADIGAYSIESYKIIKD